MRTIQLGNSSLHVPVIALGCMRMHHLSTKEAANVIDNAMDLGIHFFDHADIYGAGESEEIFAKAANMTPSLREKMILQSKVGIRDGFFDFSKEHMLTAVDGILQRLQTDYLDILLLHRPDTLFEPEEVAAAFQSLRESGKVRYFGVSNQNPGQIDLLKKYVQEDLVVNQLQFGLMHTGMIDSGFQVNMKWDGAIDRDGGILEYSRLHDMTIQAWSPFQYGFFEGVFIENAQFPELNRVLKTLASDKGVTPSAIAIAWILRHPAKIQPIIGSMTPQRLVQIAEAANVQLSREEWYTLYKAAGNKLP